ncbi:hypothetical protein IH601_09915 [Candidatus Bipolaricaulota bacterium]|nr:hypothetical protein [Candidatus Bipolaricaulota bacterium]TFH09530.1 MAG: hypothetical protein E4H08_05545 [Candidatus Atribacteria bacterium]
MSQLIAILSGARVPESSSRFVRGVAILVRPFARLWKLAESHELNPWVFIAMSLVGYLAQAMVFLPPFQSQEWKLVFLILLRLIALVVPFYIFFNGRRIAAVFNVSVAAMFIFNTTWHVCYYVYA